MKIACVTATGPGETDRLISETAARLQAEDARLAGIVKVLDGDALRRHHCDMEVRVLPDGPAIAITQSLGAASQSCRLDPAAIAMAVAEVERGPLDQADLFLLNKFGPEESEGRGFCAAIGTALDRGIPVLVGVSGPSRAAFDAFAGGLAQELAPTPEAVLAWCRAAITDAR